MKTPESVVFRLPLSSGRKIAKLLGLTASDRPSKVLREVDTIIASFRHLAAFDEKALSEAEVRDRLLKLGSTAMHVLEELTALQAYSAHVPTAGFLDELAELSRVATLASNVPIARGAPKKRVMNNLINQLAELYTDYTGKKPPAVWQDDSVSRGGPFFQLVQTCIFASGYKDQPTDVALRKAIQRALTVKPRRNRRDLVKQGH